ncbi:flagellar biosynthetic protein FliO [Variovorax sp. LARHSF232]
MSLVSSLAQAGLGMGLVLCLIFLCAWLARRFGLQRLGGGQLVKTISSTAVGQRERVVVVEVAGSWLVLGVTAQQVSLLHTMAPQPLPAAAAMHQAAMQPAMPLAHSFSHLLRQSLTGKARSRTTP